MEASRLESEQDGFVHDSGLCEQKWTRQRSLLHKSSFHSKKSIRAAENLPRERGSRWISAISKDDLTDDILENDQV